jgi:hypothetical protein
VVPTTISAQITGAAELELAVKLDLYCSLCEQRPEGEPARHQPDEKLKKLCEYINAPCFNRLLMARPGPGRGTGIESLSSRNMKIPWCTSIVSLKTIFTRPIGPTSGLAVYRGRTLLKDRQEIKEIFLESRVPEDENALAKAEERRAPLFDTSGVVSHLYDDRARRERAAEKKAMERRKVEIGREILEEPDRIRGRFAVQTVRLERVGIVYLWPEMG